MKKSQKDQPSWKGRPRRPGKLAEKATMANGGLDAFARSVSDRIEQVPIDALTSFGRKSRTHSEAQLAMMMGSFDAFGFINPIIIDEQNRVLAGHARVEAAKRLGYRTVPAVIASHLTDDEKRGYAIADNGIGLKAGWDVEVLAAELSYLSSVDTSFELDVLGFSTAEIDLVIGDAEASQSATDEADVFTLVTEEAVTKLGDVWRLGDHRLVCGDALDPGAYRALLNGDKARMVLSDPPYNLAVDGFVGGLGKVKHREFGMASGEMSSSQFTTFLTSALDQMSQHAVEGGLFYIFMDWRHQRELLSAAFAAALLDHNLCVWNKMTGGMGSHYRSQHELCFIFKKGGAPHLNTVELGRHGRYRTNVWSHPGLSTFGAGRDEALASHPTVKPVALLAEAIKDCTRRGDLVLDPFLGSGSTLMAAHKTGRRGAGIELDPLYCDTIIRRFEALAGTKAIHLATGMNFDDLAALRAAERRRLSGAASTVSHDPDPDTEPGMPAKPPSAARVRVRGGSSSPVIAAGDAQNVASLMTPGVTTSHSGLQARRDGSARIKEMKHVG